MSLFRFLTRLSFHAPIVKPTLHRILRFQGYRGLSAIGNFLSSRRLHCVLDSTSPFKLRCLNLDNCAKCLQLQVRLLTSLLDHKFMLLVSPTAQSSSEGDGELDESHHDRLRADRRTCGLKPRSLFPGSSSMGGYEYR